MTAYLEPAAPQIVELDPLSLVLHASGPVAAVLLLLVGASVAAWTIAVIKHRQLGRWTTAQREFDAAIVTLEASVHGAAHEREALANLARRHPDAPGAQVVLALCARAPGGADAELLTAVAARAMVDVHQRLATFMASLASIGSSSPFIGLFGTVYGILDAFLRIGREKSATLPVVAPAIGEALIATAVGLFAAIPAVIAYNALSKRLDDLSAQIEASAREWVLIVGRSRALPGVTASVEPLIVEPIVVSGPPPPPAMSVAKDGPAAEGG